MDKEKEVKRYGVANDGVEYESKSGYFVKYKDWQSERTKREEAEKKYQEKDTEWFEFVSKLGTKYPDYVLTEIKELEAQVKELRERNARLFHYEKENQILSAKVESFGKANERYLKQMNAMSEGYRNPNGVKAWKEYQALESQLATANAKIVELENLLSICEKNAIEFNGSYVETIDAWHRESESFKKDIATANKKAEKLVELSNSLKNHVKETLWQAEGDYSDTEKLVNDFEQALKEWRGEK